jgi:hypothetical protein
MGFCYHLNLLRPTVNSRGPVSHVSLTQRASIILRKDGKVVIKESYLLSRSSSINKIKGMAVHIN